MPKEKHAPELKFEKISLWTTIPTYGHPDNADDSSLDAIVDKLTEMRKYSEIQILDYDADTLELKNIITKK